MKGDIVLFLEALQYIYLHVQEIDLYKQMLLFLHVLIILWMIKVCFDLFS